MTRTKHQPLLNWPSRDTLWFLAMKRIWQERKKTAEHDWAEEGDDAPLTIEETLLLAPDLEKRLEARALNFEPPDNVFQLLYELTDDAAAALVRELPEPAQERLHEAMRRKIQERETE